MVTAALDSCVAVEGLVVLLGALVFTLSILLVLWAFLDATLSEGKLGSGGGGSFVSLAPFGPVAIRGEAAKAVDANAFVAGLVGPTFVTAKHELVRGGGSFVGSETSLGAPFGPVAFGGEAGDAVDANAFVAGLVGTAFFVTAKRELVREGDGGGGSYVRSETTFGPGEAADAVDASTAFVAALVVPAKCELARTGEGDAFVGAPPVAFGGEEAKMAAAAPALGFDFLRGGMMEMCANCTSKMW